MKKIKRSHLKSKESPFYTTGIIDFINYRNSLTNKVCSRCSKDLNNATRYEWCVHHKDHDRSNNNIENFELLCKRCHQIEHYCIKSLQIVYDKECFICDSKFKSKASNSLYCSVCNPIYRRYKHKYNKYEIKQMIIEGKV